MPWWGLWIVALAIAVLGVVTDDGSMVEGYSEGNAVRQVLAMTLYFLAADCLIAGIIMAVIQSP